MNISEANDVNTVLRHFLRVPNADDDSPEVILKRSEAAHQAARRFAERAHNRLMAGLTPAKIDQYW